jgi:hypothetical protein
MGTYDSFYDEESTCPKCQATVKREWQTRRLERLFEHWKKRDFLQYRRWEPIPERERKKKFGNSKLAPAFRITEKFERKTSLLLAGKVPVYNRCNTCKSRLSAHAKITDGKFVGIVEAEVGDRDKEFIRIFPRTTAKTLREEFAERLSHLQESCKHERKQWQIMGQSLGPVIGRERVCLRCEKVLETMTGFEENEIDPNDPIFKVPFERRKQAPNRKRRKVKHEDEKQMSDHDKILYGKPSET